MGFGSYAFARFQRALEKAIEHRAGGAGFVGKTIGFANLAEDFSFAEEERVQAGGNTEEMADGGAIIVLVEDAIENIGANGMEFAEERGQAGGSFVAGFGRDAVDLAAIAGGENEGFFEETARTEFVGGAAGLFGSEGNALAELDRGGAVI